MQGMSFQRREPMEQQTNNRKILWLALISGLILIAGWVLLGKSGCTSPQKKQSDTVYAKGKTDTVFTKGKTDTVTNYIPYPVYVEKPTGQHFGKDSSRYTVTNLNGSVDVVTFPATDSIRIEIEPVTIERLITRVDTLLLHRIDTLTITNTITAEQPWYDTFLAGAGTVVVLVLTTLGLITF